MEPSPLAPRAQTLGPRGRMLPPGCGLQLGPSAQTGQGGDCRAVPASASEAPLAAGGLGAGWEPVVWALGAAACGGPEVLRQEPGGESGQTHHDPGSHLCSGSESQLFSAWSCASGPAFRGGEVTPDQGLAVCEGSGGLCKGVGGRGRVHCIVTLKPPRPGPPSEAPPWPLTGGPGVAFQSPPPSSVLGERLGERMPEAPARFKLRFSREMRTVPAAACVPPRAIIRPPKYKNISQFVLFMEHSISTWKGTPRPASWLRSAVPPRPALQAPGALGPPGGRLLHPALPPPRAPPALPDVCGHGRVQPPEVGAPRGTGHPRPSGSMGHCRSVCLPGVLVFIF